MSNGNSFHDILHDTKDAGEMLRLLREAGWFDEYKYLTKDMALRLHTIHWRKRRAESERGI